MSSSSHGQRFRRRAIRRGYKVDEVDAFLDRVEATINGSGAGRVTAQDVHDVVFRVRFGGYDEWQVDLHLDRVERQIAELEERSMGPGVGAQLRAAMSSPVDRGGPPPPPLPTRTPSAHVPTSTLPRFDQPFDGPPRRDDSAYVPTGSFSALPPDPIREPSGSYPGFNSDLPRRGGNDLTGEIRRTDLTGEIRRSDPYGTGGFGPVSPAAPPFRQMDTMSGRGFDAAATGSFNPLPPSQSGGFGPPPGGIESQRIDQLRRTFQLRRFGSGYDPSQVDRLFDTVAGALAGRGGVNESELDPTRLALVPGGYYEAEVDQAIREAREILRSR
ncbi:DivIVA domain-containing protein [Catelliglobosispora koreensis]|uniref:DivIVA domain-containing protein n=1 Tax=Catelliglobosispora koreensis TaxID=129052 RepID=UPI000377C0C5|nr:DivIVA domain-containing protein [Catelliglobosispora koreensis]